VTDWTTPVSEAEQTENRNARFLPAIRENAPTGDYTTVPCLLIGGGAHPETAVYVYLADGDLHVDIYPDDDQPVRVTLREKEIYDG
jgi:hypothetical protein